ncbi:alcohol dehydrogenase catalytic domain-containing protein [Cupriavidus necator]|nr:alcohol dehydrogenase catalytic domain-containing protein [Cupriavidus necator]
MPKPVAGPGQVLVKIGGAGVCHSDLHVLDHGIGKTGPFTLGHENAGWVGAVGDGVTGWKEGDPVAVYVPWGCGICRTCQTSAENYCEGHARSPAVGGGLGLDGGMAEFMIVPSPRLAHKSGTQLLPSLSRVTPSAASEHQTELIGCSISRSLTTYCVCLELRPLPSTGITRLHRYYGPLRRPKEPGLSLAGVRLAIPDHVKGLPVLLRFPCAHAVATTPAQRLGVLPAHPPSRISLPRTGGRVGLRIDFFEVCSAFTRVTACTLARSPKFVTRYTEGFSHFVTSIAAPVASGWSGCRAGLAPAGKAPPLHGARQFESVSS